MSARERGGGEIGEIKRRGRREKGAKRRDRDFERQSQSSNLQGVILCLLRERKERWCEKEFAKKRKNEMTSLLEVIY